MSAAPAPRPTAVTAEIVANVIRIEVAQGDPVTAGQTLLVLESMKMEMPIDAPADGTVGRIAVAVGDVVQEGDLMVEISEGGGR